MRFQLSDETESRRQPCLQNEFLQESPVLNQEFRTASLFSTDYNGYYGGGPYRNNYFNSSNLFGSQTQTCQFSDLPVIDFLNFEDTADKTSAYMSGGNRNSSLHASITQPSLKELPAIQTPVIQSCPDKLPSPSQYIRHKRTTIKENKQESTISRPKTHGIKKRVVHNGPKRRKITTESPNQITDEQIGDSENCCKCKKTMCLKLYCECFAKRGFCGAACECSNCHNSRARGDLRNLIILEILDKNPFAFSPKIKHIGGNDKKDIHSRGCNCKKTKCNKNYCECFTAGIGCSKICQCLNCKNARKDLVDIDVLKYKEKVLRRRKKPNYLYDYYYKKSNPPKTNQNDMNKTTLN